MALTYPVDLTKTYVAVRKSDLTIIKRGFSWPRADGMPIENLDPSIAIGLIVNLPEPAYDPLTQKLVETETLDVPNQQLVIGYNVVALTQAELDSVAEQQADDALKLLIQQGIADLKAGAGTATERLVRVEKACVYLLKQVTGIK